MRLRGAARVCVAGLLAAATPLAGVIALPTPASAAPGEITTIAGAPGEGLATAISQQTVSLVQRGTSVYVASGTVVRLIDTTTGHERLFAGTGIGGFSGDGGQATAARLAQVRGIAMDPMGNLYVATTARIRKVTPAGFISTFAGNGVLDEPVDGANASESPLGWPTWIQTDDTGNVYFADGTGIRRIDALSQSISTMVRYGDPVEDGGTVQSLCGLDLDSSGNILFGDGSAIRRYSAADGTVNTVPTAGAATPCNPVLDSTSNTIYFHEFTVVKKLESTGNVTTVAGGTTDGPHGDGGPATEARLVELTTIVLTPSGDLILVDVGGNRVRVVDTSGIITTLAGNGAISFSGDNGPAVDAQVGGETRSGPFRAARLARDAGGNLYIGDRLNNRVRKIDASGTITTIAGNGSSVSSGDGGPAIAAGLQVAGVAVDGAGNIFVVDDTRVRKINAAGVISTVAALFAGAEGICVDAAGNLYLPYPNGNVVRKINPSGAMTILAGTGSAGFSGDGGSATGPAAQLSAPTDVMVDSLGNFFIADTGNNRVRKVDPGGIISTVAGNGASNWEAAGDGGPATKASVPAPVTVALDASGNLLIGSRGLVRRVVDGIVWTAAGTVTHKEHLFTGDGAGDGGPANAAVLGSVYGLVVDSAGNLLISGTADEGGAGRIRRVEAPLPVRPARFVAADFNGDFESNPSVYRPSTGTWFAKGGLTTVYGVATDIPVPADYDGDHVSDAAVYRPGGTDSGAGVWYIQRSTGGETTFAYGTTGDVPVPADYDGDGRADVALFRPSTGTWFIRQSSNDTERVVNYGTGGDVAVPADYDGDSKTDIAVLRTGTQALWFIRNSQSNAESVVAYGTAGDVPVVADYDGDTRADVGVFRQSTGTWFIAQSTGEERTANYGTAGDVPSPGDYDGDGRADLGVYRPENSTWYVWQSTNFAQTATHWGMSGDVPLVLAPAIRLAYFG
ncbi:MAG TPA: hypothetical protein VM121_02540 [Acidimicrobiales bacterium]|nr:hypothetical protein [Acidimicrobiales bacterium]